MCKSEGPVRALSLLLTHPAQTIVHAPGRIICLYLPALSKNLCTLLLFGDNLSKTDFCNFSEEVKNEQHTTRESGCNY